MLCIVGSSHRTSRGRTDGGSRGSGGDGGKESSSGSVVICNRRDPPLGIALRDLYGVDWKQLLARFSITPLYAQRGYKFL